MNEALSPPDLTTPGGRAAYRRELNQVARPVRYGGIALALTGFGIGLTRFTFEPWPDALRLLALVLCLLGIALIGVGVVARTRYHLRRLAGR